MPLALLLALLTSGAHSGPLPGEAVLRSAYAKYAGRWPHTITYLQKTVTANAPRPETWYTALELPGKMRVDIAPMGTGRALIFRSDSQYGYGGGRLRTQGPYDNPLLLLLHDLHTQPVARTIEKVKALHIDLSRTRNDSWEGRPVVVVGAGSGDLTSNQIWFDKERLILVRILLNGRDLRRALEIRVGGYERAGGGWLERRVDILNGGQIVQAEEYSDVKINPGVEAGLFAPGGYSVPKWVGELKDVFGGLPGIPQGLQRGGGGR